MWAEAHSQSSWLMSHDQPAHGQLYQTPLFSITALQEILSFLTLSQCGSCVDHLQDWLDHELLGWRRDVLDEMKDQYYSHFHKHAVSVQVLSYWIGEGIQWPIIGFRPVRNILSCSPGRMHLPTWLGSPSAISNINSHSCLIQESHCFTEIVAASGP